MNKGIVAGAVVVLAVVVIIFASVFKDLPTENPLPEEIEIFDLDGLVSMESGKRYILTTDISMEGVDSHLPYGRLNGNGHSITGFTQPLFQNDVSLNNIKLSGSASGIKTGLLSANGGTIHLTNVQVNGNLTTSGVDPCGGIAPYMYGSIEGCTIDITITGKAPAAEIAGVCSSIQFKDTKILGNVGSERHASGIVYTIGDSTRGGSLTFENTILSSTIKSAGSASGIAKTTELKNVELTGLSFRNCTIQGVQNVGAIFSELNLELKLGSFIYDNAIVKGEQYVGGLFGKVNKVMIEGMSNDSGLKVIGLKSSFKDAYIGGIAGYAHSTVKGCTNYAEVENQGTGRYTGGVVGYVDSAAIVESVNKGAVSSKGDYTGGMAGGAFPAFNTDCLRNCINYADITGSKGVGGIFGFVTITKVMSFGEVKSCVNTGKISGRELVNQIVGDDSYSKLKDCSEEGSISMI